MSDPFSTLSAGLQSPASKHFAITPNDSTDLAVVPRALYVGVSGDIVILDSEGTEVTYVDASGLLPIRATRVKSSGTTATSIIGIY